MSNISNSKAFSNITNSFSNITYSITNITNLFINMMQKFLISKNLIFDIKRSND